ncbi:MAG: fimbrillin family protein [Bacteroidales bacterium]|nr:fimbrillin family protein [Bacteroidales bacterium]
MMKKILLAIAALATLFSCSSIDEIAGDKYAAGDYVESVEMTVEDFEDDNAITRTALSNLTDTGAKFAWAEKDTVGIFPNVGDQVSFSMAAGAGTSSATFNGGGWALRTNATYSAYYPFSYDNGPKDNKNIGINMVGQTQTGSDTTSEIGKYDIMAAAPASAETGNVKFAFKHQVSICRIKLTLPENKSFKSVKVIAPNKKFITKATMDISGSMPAITATETSEEISLSLKNFSTTSTNRELVANMYVLPVDMSQELLTINVTDTEGNVYSAKDVSGVSFEKAKIRVLSATPLPVALDGEGEGEDFTGDGEEIEQPLTFSGDYLFVISIANHGGNAPNLEYSIDGGPWILWDYSPVKVETGHKISFRGDNPRGFSKAYNIYSGFETSSSVIVDGNIMSIVSKNNYSSLKTIPASWCFYRLFREGYLLKAPLLPATTLASRCYESMFEGCEFLHQAPALPATTLAPSCYKSMFKGGCTRNFIEAPALPATTLAYSCYESMFEGCTRLTQAPVLPATTLESSCYYSMFEGCTNLVEAPALPATTLASYCYHSMFKGCTNLVEAPALPATTLASSCYYSMFEGCTNLVEAPALPATTLASYCYASMFEGCTSLKRVRAAFTTTPGDDYTFWWLRGVSSTGTFYKNKNATWSNIGAGIPEGWTVIKYEP